MRWLAAGLLAVLAGTASADPVNLLTSAPSVVAVSSSVANAAIKPEHLVDGKLDTAWNSRTGELVGSWIAFRVPPGAHVTAIKLTAGFTKADKAGDLFTGNPRVTEVRVSRHDHALGVFALDPENRGLQTIAIDQAGGDFTIEVTKILPGKNASWRETCVSELEVWGTLAANQAVVASKPVVRVGGLDALPTPSFDECRRAVFPDARGARTGPDDTDDWLTDWDALGVGRDLAVCKVEHNAPGSYDVSVELAVMHRAKGAWTKVATRTETYSKSVAQMTSIDGSVSMALFPLTTSENAVIFDVQTSHSGPMQGDSTDDRRLDRITATGFAPLLAFHNSDANGESRDADLCKLPDVTPLRAVPPKRIDLACTHTEGRYHGEDPRGNGDHSDDSVRRFRFDGTTYVEDAPKP